MTAAERLWARTRRASDHGCWEWTGYRLADGYGQIKGDGRKVVRVHRLAYEISRGPIPAGLTIDHLCRNRACVNPAHLEAVTGRENLLRGDTFQGRNARKSECQAGHPFTAENTYRNRRGHRQCRICKARLGREWRAKRKADAP